MLGSTSSVVRYESRLEARSDLFNDRLSLLTGFLVQLPPNFVIRLLGNATEGAFALH